jgi:hypothetical protein
VASSEAPDVIHRAMRPVSYHCIAMAIEIAIDSPAFFVAVNLFFFCFCERSFQIWRR